MSEPIEQQRKDAEILKAASGSTDIKETIERSAEAIRKAKPKISEEEARKQAEEIAIRNY